MIFEECLDFTTACLHGPHWSDGYTDQHKAVPHWITSLAHRFLINAFDSLPNLFEFDVMNPKSTFLVSSGAVYITPDAFRNAVTVGLPPRWLDIIHRVRRI